jgi:hypothetical protein
MVCQDMSKLGWAYWSVAQTWKPLFLESREEESVFIILGLRLEFCQFNGLVVSNYCHSFLDYK